MANAVRTSAQSGDGTKRIFVLGATGTIGRATVAELVGRGHHVTCLVRSAAATSDPMLSGAELRMGDIGQTQSLAKDGFRDEAFDILLSCLASRTGEPGEAWAIDHDAHLAALALAREAGVSHMILLSAICVQKPKLAFQEAKLAFERALVASGITYSIVRPTAFFKSLSGQVGRVLRGRPFLLFGDGELTACKPISDGDLARYLADCIDRSDRHDQILPIGGPGPAITPSQQGEMLFELLGKKPRFRHVPIGVLDVVIGVLAFCGRIVPAARRKAEYARIGRYYATESMLVWDAERDSYRADLTPSTGQDRLKGHYARLIGLERADD